MASAEIATLVDGSTRYLIAALSAYGGAVLAKTRDDASDATVSVGRRLLQKVFGTRKDGDPLPAPLAAAVAGPEDDDALGALRLAIRAVLESDADMLAEVRRLLAPGRAAVRTTTITSGRDTYYAERDITISRPVE
jgi:hypothetical protein